jgi:plastocyanin
MRSTGSALLTLSMFLAACGGGETKQADTAASAPAAAAPAPAAAPAAGTATMAPITGTTHEVKMLLDDKGAYKFEPVALTAKVGDGVKFILISGAPHNIAFDAATVPEDVKPQLAANLPNTMGNLDSPMLMNANETWTVSLGGIKPGKYSLICTPHLAMGMKMELTVVP